MTTVVVAGALANKAGNGGEAWVRLSWARGLQRLGCAVHFVEQIAPQVCVDAAGQPADFGTSANLRCFTAVTATFGLGDSATLIHGEGERVHGMGIDRLSDLADSADLLVNISGHLRLPRLLSRFKRRAYVDIDPGFTQFWHRAGALGRQLLDHHLHFTIGENVGHPGCAIPTGGLKWIPVRQPVVLDDWPPTQAEDPNRLTTVGTWRGPYGPIEHEDRRFGLKVHEFRRFVELPHRAVQRLELAMAFGPGDQTDRTLLLDHGWALVDPGVVALEPERFRAYVQGSGGEFSVAQGVYVQTGSGWFSDRSARYLASGKPVLIQDTGFSRHLPTGEGVVAFRTLDDAAVGAAAIAAHYERHAGAARAIAEDHFDSDRVLGRFLDQAGVG